MSEWKPRYIVHKRLDVTGPPIQDDEPCLVVRAQDILAGPMLDFYLRSYRDLPACQSEVLTELAEHRTALVEWQRTHVVKVADR